MVWCPCLRDTLSNRSKWDGSTIRATVHFQILVRRALPIGHGVTQQPSLPAMQAFAELGRMDMATMELEDVLKRVAELAEGSIPGAVDVSVTLVEAGRSSTAAHTGPRALHLDELQYGFRRGPCVDAAEAGAVHVIDDMESEERWPHFAARAVEQGIHSSVSVGLPMRPPVTSSLNVYGDKSQAFNDEIVKTATTFAAYAAVALANAYLYHSIAEVEAKRHAAMTNQATIEQAKGIVAAQRKCTPEAALAMLRQESDRTHRRLRDVAAEIVSEATRPEAPPPT